jgi:hypothetical protein
MSMIMPNVCPECLPILTSAQVTAFALEVCKPPSRARTSKGPR